MDIIDKLAQDRIDEEYAYWQEHNPDKLATATEEIKREYEERTRRQLRELAQGIADKSPEFVKRVAQGFLHPSNKRLRKLFCAVTGLTLPSTVKGTSEVAQRYLGDRLTDYRNAQEKERQDRIDAENAKTQERRTKHVAELTVKCAADDPLTAEELLTLARALSVPVHPRTAGAIRHHVVTITSAAASVYKRKNRPPQTIYSVYGACQQAIQGQTSP